MHNNNNNNDNNNKQQQTQKQTKKVLQGPASDAWRSRFPALVASHNDSKCLNAGDGGVPCYNSWSNNTYCRVRAACVQSALCVQSACKVPACLPACVPGRHLTLSLSLRAPHTNNAQLGIRAPRYSRARRQE
jgi:hypothetical protein